ncbi:MAG: hypothetical protein ABIN89_01335 [Chitinophagaceae bacterium]
MKLIKLFVISVVVLFLLLTALSSLLPSKVRISRAIDIPDSSGIVLSKIKDFKQWELWNEYVKALTGKKVTTDSIYANELSITVTHIDDVTVNTIWRQQNGKTFPGVFNLIPHASITTVQWYFEFTIKWYPWEKFGSIIYDKQLGPQMEKSLRNLNQLLEKAP